MALESVANALSTFGHQVTEPPFWLGLGMVYFFARNRFRIHQCERDAELDPPLEARAFTTRLRYGLAESSYVGVFWFLYVLLVCVASFPFLQEILFRVLGGAGIVSEGGMGPGDRTWLRDAEAIGTPAWSALVATSILPSIPAFGAADRRLRFFLQDFASIPAKAHRLAEHLVRAVCRAAPDPEGALARLTEIRRELGAEGAPRVQRGYREFFRQYEAFLREVDERLARLRRGGAGGSSPEVLREEYARAAMRYGRYLSCAMLVVEPSEYSARRRLREHFALDLDLEGWQFKVEQIAIAAVIVSVLTVLGTLGTAAVYARAGGLSAGWSTIVGQSTGWVFFSVPMFTLPLIFAAGVQLYLTDRERYDGGLVEWEDRFLAYAVTFLGAAFLGALPPLVGFSLRETAVSRIEAQDFLTRVLAWGLPPGVFAVTFLMRSASCRWVLPEDLSAGEGDGEAEAFAASPQGAARGRALVNVGVDFLVHGIPAGVVTFGVGWMAFAPDQRLMRVLTFPVSFLICGFLGAAECRISRRFMASAPCCRRPAPRPDPGGTEDADTEDPWSAAREARPT